MRDCGLESRGRPWPIAFSIGAFSNSSEPLTSRPLPLSSFHPLDSPLSSDPPSPPLPLPTAITPFVSHLHYTT